MKPTQLSQAIFFGLTTIALTACGSSDDDINTINTTPVINPTPTLTPTTPTTTTPTTNTASLANILENAKIAGLNDANAALFAEKVKNLSFGSPEYNEALIKARQEQTDAINKALAEQAKAVSPIVDTNNPFIDNVDIREVATVSSNHYVRQQGSTYDLTANPTGIAGLGGVAIDDPTTSNPWLSNYVLGTEVVRDGTGKPTVIAIDSAGEMVEPDSTIYPDGARKLGVMFGSNAGYDDSGQYTERVKRLRANHIPLPPGDAPSNNDTTTNVLNARKSSPYHTIYNGLLYRTQSNNGERLYNYNAKHASNSAVSGANNRVWTLQEQYSQHGTTPRKNLITNALLAAKNQNYNQYPANANSRNGGPTTSVPCENCNPYIIDGNTGKNRSGTQTPGSYSDYTRSGLIVYNDDSVSVGHETGKKLGYKVPTWGREENVYQIDEKTDKLEVINGVDPLLLSPTRINTDAAARTWYGSRYGSYELIDNINTATNSPYSAILVANGDVLSSNPDPFNGVKVANNDQARVFGKNSLGYEAGATGKQTNDNTYTAKYGRDEKLTASTIQPAKLHHVQYGRLTNNIDVLAESEVGKKGANGNDRVIYRGFQPHGAPNSVDTYFYRGTNHTTIDQMKALKGGVIQYHGHALTYNLGPYAVANAKEQVGLPTAYGNNAGSGNTIGNFVQAKFDVAKSTLEGSIYNFIAKSKAGAEYVESDFKKQDLATFKGNVYGNTVVGTAEKVGVEGTGSLTASFFGPNATEIGGNISSVSRAEGYGDAKWGAVFGATRGSAIEQFNVIETNNVNP